MKTSRPVHIHRFFATAVLLLASGLGWAGEEDESAWIHTIKPQFFGERVIDESGSVIELTAPYRAEDPALTPIQITAKIPQTPGYYIKTLSLFIDNNPVPFSARFDLTPDSGKADLAMRVRVNSYTHVRAIAETSDAKLYMAKAYVKASGGCSAPIGTDIEAAMARMGKMKFKLEGNALNLSQPNQVQLLISHPNITGLQMDQISRLVKPPHFVDTLKVSFNGKPLLSAQTDIAISADPNFRFFFKPDQAGELKAEIKDNLNNRYAFSQTVSP
jgi:sulfur-oxidizing protein SoxY